MTRLVLPRGDDFSLHLDEIAAAMDVGLPVPAVASELEFVFLCFTNRCGSNLVAEALASDGRVNLAAECYNAAEVLRAARQLKLTSFSDYFAGVALHDQRSNRFIVKLAADHLTLLFHAGILSAIANRSRFIFVERSDKLGQAISMCLAETTLAWASYNNPACPPELVAFSRGLVDHHIELILRQNLFFERFFAINGIVPHRVIYEHFVASPDTAVRALGHALGLSELCLRPENVRTKAQRGPVNTQWRQTYLAMRATDGTTG